VFASASGVALKAQFPGAVPEIPVRDIKEAAAYYKSSLGFTVDWGGEELGLGVHHLWKRLKRSH
jgi:hypothetical protein